MAPAGQLWTSVGDLAALAIFLSGAGLAFLRDDAVEMREPIAINDVPEQPWAAGYGMGLQL